MDSSTADTAVVHITSDTPVPVPPLFLSGLRAVDSGGCRLLLAASEAPFDPVEPFPALDLFFISSAWLYGSQLFRSISLFWVQGVSANVAYTTNTRQVAGEVENVRKRD